MECREQLSPPPSNSNAGEKEFCSLGGFTPEELCSTVSIPEATNSLNRLQIVESPKSLLKCSDGKRSRLNSEAKGKVLFYKKQDNVIWSDNELYSLILFMMLFTDGKIWVSHKNSKFWEDAGKFVQQQSCTAHCRTGKAILVL